MQDKTTPKISALFAAVGILIAASAATAAEAPGNGVQVKPCTSTSIEGLFHQLIPAMGLTELGYKVSAPLTLAVPAVHQAVSSGDCSYAVDHWVPLHDSFFEPIKTSTTRLGPTIQGAGQGYLVDKKTAEANGISNLAQFKDAKIAALFDSDGNGKANLAGANPGWGSELVINHELDAIGLRDTIDHDQGEYSVIIADTVARYRRGEPVLFYTWMPNWIVGEMADTIWLDVDTKFCPPKQPCGSSTTGFPVNAIATLGNNDFLAENPAAKSFLNSVKIPIEDINAENLQIRAGEDKEADVKKHAEAWIAAHRSEFDAWIAAAKAAAN